MISGIILAAGLSKRMGKTKQDLLVGGRPMLRRVVDAFLSSGIDEVVVVVRAGLRWTPTSGPRLKIIANPGFAEGISSSLRVGLRSIDSRSKAAVVGLGDKPLVAPSTIRSLLSAYEASGSKIVVPTYMGRRGNPVLIDRAMFAQLLKLRGDVGAKRVMERNEESVLELPVDDEGILVDVDTPADLRRAEKLLATRERLRRKGETGQ